jgi:hypothetical protein
MLEMRPSCERCDRDLPPDSQDAMVCSFECTFCRTCVEGELGGVCPNCHGNFEKRPLRVGTALERNPAVTERTYRPVT